MQWALLLYAILTICNISAFQGYVRHCSGSGRAFLVNTMPKRNIRTAANAKSDANTRYDATSIQYFLLKSEPNDYSITDLERDVREEWNGIRNYQARNFLRTMKVGDRAFFYHSKAATPALTGIVGTCRIVRGAQPDVTALDAKSEYYDAKCTKEDCKWDSVLVEFERSFPVVLSLKELKNVALKEPDGIIANLALLKQSRLSVVPLDREQWDEVIRLIDDKVANLEVNGDSFDGTRPNNKRFKEKK
jgi:predicted RNA-binding protein with PUA-like domain